MTRIYIAVILSLALHINIVVICNKIIYQPHIHKPTEIVVLFQNLATNSKTILVHKDLSDKKTQKPLLQREPTTNIVSDLPDNILLHDSTEISNIDTTNKVTDLFALTSSRFKLLSLLSDHPQDSTQRLRIQSPFHNLSELKNQNPTPLFGDRLDREIRKQNTGHEQPVHITNLIKPGIDLLSKIFKNDKKIKLTKIPTDAQLEALNVVWEQKEATNQMIYSLMDSSVKLTAQDMNTVLEEMVQDGLLTREIVSPENKLTVMAFQVEMSRQNLKNRIYQYKTDLKRDEMVTFLNAILYQMKNNDQKVTNSANPAPVSQHKLLNKILRITTKKPVTDNEP